MTTRTLSLWTAVAVVLVGTVISIAYAMAVPALPTPPQEPRDRSPNQARPASDTEQQLQAAVASRPQDWHAARELAKLQERRGAIAEAEATLLESARAVPTESAPWQGLAAFYVRHGQFERAVETLEGAAERDPSNAPIHHLAATFYFAKLSDPTLRREDRFSYIARGIALEDRALAADPAFLDALVYKSLFLRAQAEYESNTARRVALLQQADDLRSRASTLGPSANTASPEIDDITAHPAPPPPPPVPGAGDIKWVYAETSFVPADGAITLKKIKDVRPVYPPMAIRLGVEGRVVVQAAVDQRGYVVSARVIESIPLLNQSTIDAVQQWRFDPFTMPNGPSPILINVEARFFPEK